MLHERIVSIADQYWAAHLGRTAGGLFGEPLRVVTHGEELADYCGVFALFRGDGAVASVPADRADALRVLLSGQTQGCSPGSFAVALSSVAKAIIGPAYIGYADAILQPAHPARALGSGDVAALHMLQQACDATEWEHGGSEGGHPCSGIFVEGELVAVAGYKVWGGGIAHISIVTHPGFRGHGYGRSAVAHLAERAICAGLLPQYRTLESNRASIRLAESLGFRSYATSVAVRLDKNPALGA